MTVNAVITVKAVRKTISIQKALKPDGSLIRSPMRDEHFPVLYRLEKEEGKAPYEADIAAAKVRRQYQKGRLKIIRSLSRRPDQVRSCAEGNKGPDPGFEVGPEETHRTDLYSASRQEVARVVGKCALRGQPAACCQFSCCIFKESPTAGRRGGPRYSPRRGVIGE